MDINKVNWTNSKEQVKMAFPIAKVDVEKRTVSGFATLDNLDRHGDIVLPEASEKAFARFRGNLREMHQPIAVGKVVSFEPQDYFDIDEGVSYKGIYVNAYISKGAQDTWEKVLDGTLTGFSIGGNILEVDPNSADTRVIADYELMELSLVDNPANPLANIFSIQKNAQGSMTMKGIATEVSIENVFWCSTDQVATASEVDSKDCVICGDAMSTIGWVEKSDVNKSEIVKALVLGQFVKDSPAPDNAAPAGNSDTITSNDTINLYPDQNKVKKDVVGDNLLSEGGNNEMADETNVVEAAPVEEVAVEAVAEVAEAVEAVEKAATVSELPGDELDFVKMVDTLKGDLTAAIEKNYADATTVAQEAQTAVEETASEFKKSVDGLSETLATIAKSVETLTEAFEGLQSRVDAYESATAVKKSGETAPVTTDDKTITKSIWQGHFLGVETF
jgi:hypothetical protein